jgi:hypothetical protein
MHYVLFDRIDFIQFICIDLPIPQEFISTTHCVKWWSAHTAFSSGCGRSVQSLADATTTIKGNLGEPFRMQANHTMLGTSSCRCNLSVKADFYIHVADSIVLSHKAMHYCLVYSNSSMIYLIAFLNPCSYIHYTEYYNLEYILFQFWSTIMSTL